jgi:hypothetical protein
MSVFTALPQDMLQWEINRFLDPLSRLQWNQVLKSDERVYKKLPIDYAIKHQIKLSLESYRDLTWKLKNNIDRIMFRGHFHVEHLLGAVKLLKKFFAFFKDPKNQIVLMHVKGRKERFADLIMEWCDEDFEIYTLISTKKRDELRIEAAEVALFIASIPFLRDVPVKNHLSAFAS